MGHGDVSPSDSPPNLLVASSECNRHRPAHRSGPSTESAYRFRDLPIRESLIRVNSNQGMAESGLRVAAWVVSRLAASVRARTVGVPPCMSAGTIQRKRSVSPRKLSKALRLSGARTDRS
jgi:hypothetical protein